MSNRPRTLQYHWNIFMGKYVDEEIKGSDKSCKSENMHTFHFKKKKANFLVEN